MRIETDHPIIFANRKMSPPVCRGEVDEYFDQKKLDEYSNLAQPTIIEQARKRNRERQQERMERDSKSPSSFKAEQERLRAESEKGESKRVSERKRRKKELIEATKEADEKEAALMALQSVKDEKDRKATSKNVKIAIAAVGGLMVIGIIAFAVLGKKKTAVAVPISKK